MKSQWECIQQNIGAWHGSFTQFSPDGKQLKDTPSVLTLSETEPGQTMQLTLERTPEDSSKDVVTREFSHPGPAPYVYFFEDGSFTQGTSHWASFGQFGVEMSIKEGDRRDRFVIMYDGTSGGTSQIKYVTLIRETQKGGTQFTEPSLTPEQLLGQWEGTAEVLHSTMDPMTTGNSHWLLESNPKLTCKEQFDDNVQSLVIDRGDRATLSSDENLVLEGDLTYQLMPLPNGAYCLLPQTICKDKAFRIEVGWLRAGDRRSRLIRYYDSRGVWMHSALIKDHLSA
ncbi:MAG: DUF3598 family protein [Phormidesmis sp.]